MRFQKMHHPGLMKYRVELVVGWRTIPLTGWWFKSPGWRKEQ